MRVRLTALAIPYCIIGESEGTQNQREVHWILWQSVELSMAQYSANLFGIVDLISFRQLLLRQFMNKSRVAVTVSTVASARIVVI